MVPNVIGAKLGTAKARIKARHCRVGKLPYVKSTKKKKGKVVRESPKAGKRLGNNAKVSLWLGKGSLAGTPSRAVGFAAAMAGAEIGIFGGSGFYSFLDDVEEVELETPYGKPRARSCIGELEGKRVAFLPRHGRNHELPPHAIPYRANVWGMKELGVRRIIGPNASGALQGGAAARRVRRLRPVRRPHERPPRHLLRRP